MPGTLSNLSASAVLAWRPLLDPIALHEHWYILLVPLAVGIAIAYKAVRVPDPKHFWRPVAEFATMIVVGMAALGAATYLFVEVFVAAFG
jgi:hypothetical protein